MAQKTLIIGIGSTGLRILEEAQQYHYEFTGRNKPGNNVEFLYLETDTSNESKSTAGGKSEIHPVMCDFTNINVDVKQLTKSSSVKSDWIPPIEYLEQGTIGAGGMPSFGRLSLWKASNFNNLRTEILNKFNDINGDANTLIYVVGSLTGGTGSGICVDLAYLLQETLPQCRSNMQALLLLPDSASFANHKALHENTFSALSAIDHFSDINNKFTIKWPDGTPEKTYTSPPFQMVQFISQDFSNGNHSLNDLGELVKVAGMKVLMTIINTNTTTDGLFEDSLARRRVDQIGAGNLGAYNSFGFNMIQYPKAQLKELLSIKISSALINSIVDAEYYISKSSSKKPIAAQSKTFQKNSKLDFEDMIENSLTIFDNITTPDGALLADDMRNITDEIISGKLQRDDKGEMHNKFNTVNINSYYGLFNSSKSIFRNMIIDELANYAERTTEKYKNLVITRLHIQEISNYIDELIEFYNDRYGLDGKEQSWDHFLGIKIDELFMSKLDFDLTLSKRDYYNYIFTQLKEVLKLQIIIPELRKLKDQLLSENITQSLAGKTLPSVHYISDLISNYKELSTGDDVRMTLHKRKTSLEASLERYSTSFTMLFETGKMGTDIQNALDKYNRSDSKIGFEQLLGGSSIWSFVQQDFDLLYRKAIDNSVGYINEQDLFSSSLIEIIDKIDPRDNNDNRRLTDLFTSNRNIIKKSIPAMFGIDSNYTTGDDATSKLIIISSDSNKYNNLFTNYEINALNDNAVDLVGLNDVIVLYQEYATTTNEDDKLINPLRHINSIPLVKDHIKRILDREDKGNTPTYFIKKSPYLNREQLNKIIS